MILAYPQGKYSVETIEAAQESGYVGAVTVREGIVRKGDEVFRLKRNLVDSSTTFYQFKAKVSDAVGWYEKLKGGRD